MSLDEATVKERVSRRRQFAAAAEPSRSSVVRGEAVIRRATALLTVREPDTYGRGSRDSYFADLVRSARGLHGAKEAAERLRRHEVDVSAYPEFRALDRADGNGGHFVPPSYLVEDYIALARAGRTYANLPMRHELPPGTSTLRIPKLLSGTATAMQTADNAPVAEQDLEDISVRADVKTNAGQTNVALQLLDQSPVNFDEVIFQDLIADYATKIDLQTLNGSNANGQVKGVHATPGIQTVAMTGAPTVAKFYAIVADAIHRVHMSRFLPPTHIVMHPRRWAWLTAALDNNDRPLAGPAAQAPTNTIAALDSVASEGIVGSMQGVPVVLDPNIATTRGAGANEDLVYVQRSSDLQLWESTVRSRVMPEIGGKNLMVCLQVYGYMAFTAERHPQSVVEITGLTQPVFG